MRLSELEPKWLELDGKRIGFTFLSPGGHGDRLTCFNQPVPFKLQVQIMHAAMGTKPGDDEDWPINWVPSKSDFGWQINQLTDFDTVTVTPSIDASASGNWHGYITNGQIC